MAQRRARAAEYGIQWPRKTTRGYNVEEVLAAIDAVEQEMRARGLYVRSEYSGEEKKSSTARERLLRAQEELVRLRIAKLRGSMITREEHLAKVAALGALVAQFYDAVRAAVEAETRDARVSEVVESVCRQKAEELAKMLKA